MTPSSPRGLRTIASAAVVLFAVSSSLLAQVGNIQVVVFDTVKADRIAEYVSLRTDLAALMKKAGAETAYTVWSSATGDREFARVRFITKWAELDGGPNTAPDPKLVPHMRELTALQTRIQATLESSRRVISVVQPDLSLPSRTTSLDDLPSHARVLRTTVKQDRVNDYVNLVKTEVLPAMQKSEAKRFTVTRTRFGGPVTQFSSVTFFDKWADLDSPGPIAKVLGEAGMRSLTDKVSGMIAERDVTVYTLRRGMSYMPESAALTSKK